MVQNKKKEALGLDSHQDALICSQPRISSATRAQQKDPVEIVVLLL
jgi:hypothetical protein